MNRLLLILILAMLPFSTAHATVEIKEVTSPGGIKAWLVEDHKLPLIAMSFAFRGGVEQDPADKQGLANLTMDLLTEGAGPCDASAFQQLLADHSIEMNFGAGRDEIEGSVKVLTSDRDTAFELIHLALTQPHFDPADIERNRAAQSVAIRHQFGSPEWQGRYALLQHIFGSHPYGQRRYGTLKTLAGISREDIQEFAKDHLAKDNVLVAVAGDITETDLGTALDRVFGDLPSDAKQVNIPEASFPSETATILVPRDGTQTELLFAMPGPKRDDPDWYAADIANYILGGGGFSSRLMNDVRDKKGLTYGIDTGLSPMEHAGLIIGNAATDNPKTAEAWSITLETMRHFYDQGVTEKEIDSAKDYLTGSLALEMTSTDKIAGILVTMQLEKLGIDYLARHDALIRGVTKDDIQQVIKKWFNPDRLTLTMVGKPDNMTPTETKALVRE